jgi:hypothetical protein
MWEGEKEVAAKKIIAMLGIAHKYMLGKESWSAVRPQKQV